MKSSFQYAPPLSGASILCFHILSSSGLTCQNSCTLMAAACLFYRFQLCDLVDSGPSGFSVHGILQARIMEWVAICFSRESSWLREDMDMIWYDEDMISTYPEFPALQADSLPLRPGKLRRQAFFLEIPQGSLAHHRQWLQLLITVNISCFLKQQAVFHLSE